MVESYSQGVKKPVNLNNYEEEEQKEEFNAKFVNAFFEFKEADEAAAFIADWIRVKKNNATEFTSDWPVILKKGVEFKEKIEKNPEEQKATKHLLLAQFFDKSKDDYLVHLNLSVLTSCCSNEMVPLIICRIIINNLGMMV